MDPTTKNLVIQTLQSGHSYYSLGSLSNVTGVAPATLRVSLDSEKKDIRKSIATDSEGNPLYTLNTPLSGITDVWNALRLVNQLKTE